MNIAARIETIHPLLAPDWSALDPALECVLTRIRLRAQRRVLWLRKLWSEEEPPGGKFAVTHGEVDTLVLDKDSPEAESEWFSTELVALRLTEEIYRIETEMAANASSRLRKLQRLFGLDEKENDVIQACLAAALDPSLARVYAYLQDQASRPYATEELVARLFQHGRHFRLGSQSPLQTWQLITQRDVAPGEPRVLACDPLIQGWLCGEDQLDRALLGVAHVCRPEAPLDNWPVKETARFVGRLHDRNGGKCPVRLRIVGAPGSGRRTLAACISAHLGLGLLAFESDGVEESSWPQVCLSARRHAHIHGHALAWHGENALRWRWPSSVPAAPVQFVICEPGQFPRPLTGVVDHTVEVPPLSMDRRRDLLRRYVPVSASWDVERIDALVARHRATVGVIAALADSAIETADQADEAVRETARQRLGDLVQILECPFGWEDLIIPDHLRESLEDLVFEAKERGAFWESAQVRRLFPQGRGLFALFAGATPGVGKTMAAQVIAAALQRELYRIDLSSLVSKYVGDTSKNISRALSQVPNDEVLLFDEADAAFGKRVELTDANSHFLNADTNHLLQAVENYRGIVLLATNRKSDIDPAFTRRLRYVLDFPRPDAASRLKIWQRVIGQLAGEEQVRQLRSGLERVARELETSGAQIKFGVLSALFAARRDKQQLGMKHLLHGLERELRKEGRAWSERERERLVRHA